MRTSFLRRRRIALTGILASTCLLQSIELPLAATATSTFTVTITLAATCTVASPNTLDFGTQGILSANVDQTTTFTVTCTNTTTYNVGLDAGLGSGATVATRKMTGGAATVNYTLYSNPGRTTIWGNTVGTDTVAGTGNGAAQTLTVYGRVPSQTTPAPATYTDTITVTVTY
jgi:spore coat protein U domain-containing protein, fimbrial subunit CupE1/2/3/6